MRNHNYCSFIGRIGRDPETRYLQDGTPITNFSIAVSDDYKDKNGQTVERTEWVNFVANGKTAEIVGQYGKKGMKVFVSGSLRTRKWQDKQSGQDRYTTEIRVSEFEMLEPRQQNDNGFSQDNRQQQGQQQNQNNRQQQRPQNQGNAQGNNQGQSYQQQGQGGGNYSNQGYQQQGQGGHYHSNGYEFDDDIPF